MTTKRRKLIAFVLLAVIGGVIAYPLLRRDDEPTYQGHRLSEWLAQYSAPRFDETQAAVHGIGTNALPYLLKWIDYEPPAWRTALRDKLPDAIVDRWPISEAERRLDFARLAFWFLGTNAVSAIPQLEAFMNDSTKPVRSREAMVVLLLYIGEPSIPVVKAALTDTNRCDREVILRYALELMPANHWTNAFLPIAFRALNDHDPYATNAIKHDAPDAFGPKAK